MRLGRDLCFCLTVGWAYSLRSGYAHQPYGLHTFRTPLIPKLRGQFAEFLKRDYLAASVFSTRLPESVCGTGRISLTRSFSWQCRISHFGNVFPRARLSAQPRAFHCGACLLAWPRNQHRVNLPSCVTPSLRQDTLGPEYEPAVQSPTAFALGLGPALPWEENPGPGNLRLSAEKILTSLYATYAGIRTSDTSRASSHCSFTGLQNAPLPLPRQTR